MAISLDPAQQKRSVKVRPKTTRKNVAAKKTRSASTTTKTIRSTARQKTPHEIENVISLAIPFPFKGNWERLNQPVAVIWSSARKLVNSPIVLASYEKASERLDALIEKNSRAKDLIEKSGICATMAKFKEAIQQFDKKVKEVKQPATA